MRETRVIDFIAVAVEVIQYGNKSAVDSYFGIIRQQSTLYKYSGVRLRTHVIAMAIGSFHIVVLYSRQIEEFNIAKIGCTI